MLRRDFLRRLSLSAAGLLVADDALELLTHRKVWAGHDFGAWDNRATATFHVREYSRFVEWINAGCPSVRRISLLGQD